MLEFFCIYCYITDLIFDFAEKLVENLLEIKL